MKLLILFTHLLATCCALGVIVATDLRLLGKLAHYPVRIPPPGRFEVRLIVCALAVLYVTGALLLVMAAGEPAGVMNNPKLQGKLILVALLTLNAVWLHRWCFPRLARRQRLLPLRARDAIGVAAPIALSNSLWMFCAFLGIARPWNDAVSVAQVLAIEAGLFLINWGLVLLYFAVAAREAPREKPDWIDSARGKLAELSA